MKRIILYTINIAEEGMSIQQYLKTKGFSSKNLIFFKKQPESILQNGVWVYLNSILHTGDRLTVTIDEEDSSDIAPVALPISVFYEDEDLIVINKAAGMPTIPSLNHHNDTLGNALLFYFQSKNISFTYRPVNRLDKNTSGIVLIAKHAVSASILQGQLLNKELKKSYYAIVSGVLPCQSGTIKLPIGRCDSSLITRCVDQEHGEEAVTHYRVLSQKKNYALVSITLETGRTHQIRVHFSAIGHPLAGDDLYGGDTTLLKRHALHACSLSIRQPINGNPLDFYVPLPEDLETFWKCQEY